MKLWPYGPVTGYTNRTTASGFFFDMTGSMPIGAATKVRPSMKLFNSTGDVKVKHSIEYSDDGISWTGRTEYGTARLADGEYYESSWQTLPGTTKRFARHGLFVTNNSGTSLEQVQMWLAVDFLKN